VRVHLRLLKVGSMAESLGIFVPAMVLQKALGLARVLLFAHLVSQAEYGLWGMGLMIFLVASPVATLGANHGLTRYVSLYEARGQLAAFYRRVQGRCVVAALAATAVGMAASKWITDLVIVSGSGASAAIFTYRHQLYVCLAALANVLVGALYHDMLSFMFGMRAYRLASAAELAFSVVFTIFGLAAVAIQPSAVALLVAHFAAQAIVLAAGVAALQAALKYAEGYQSPRADWQPTEADAAAGEAAVPPSGAVSRVPVEALDSAFTRVLRFGFVAMIGNIMWLAAQSVSLYLTNRRCGKEDAAIFSALLQLSQAVLIVSNSAFAVVFAHTARRWEGPSRPAAMALLETAYKALTIAMMALTIAVFAAAPLWVKLLRAEYHIGLTLLGGMLMSFQAVSNLSLLTAVVRLRERPIVIALCALAGGAANVALALWWMPRFAYAPAGAAWASGAGMLVGGTAVAIGYFVVAGVRLRPATYVLMACPVLLVLPAWAAAAVWAAVIVAARVTPLLFDSHEKRTLAHVASRYAMRLRRALPWQ